MTVDHCKVVVRTADPKAFVSLNVTADLVVTYILGEWTSTPRWLANRQLYLTYYESLYTARQAVRFADSDSCAIFKIKIHNPRQLPQWRMLVGQDMTKERLDRWLEALAVKKYSNLSNMWPLYTRMASKIMLLEEVSP